MKTQKLTEELNSSYYGGNSFGSGIRIESQFSSDNLLYNFGAAGIYCWDLANKKLVWKDEDNAIYLAKISNDNKYLILSDLQRFLLKDAKTGKDILNIKYPLEEDDFDLFKINDVIFSHDNKYFIVTWDNEIKVWNIETRKEVQSFNIGSKSKDLILDPSNSRLILNNGNKSIQIRDFKNGKILKELENDLLEINSLSLKENKLLVNSISTKIYNIENGNYIQSFIGHKRHVMSSELNINNNILLTTSQDQTIKFWNAHTGKELYTFIPIDSTDYLVVDPKGRYDGTPNARKLVYYVCGNEIVELEQFKDLGWEPNLVAKIMGEDKKPFVAKGIKDLDICGRTPQIEEKGKRQGFYQYEIKSGKGGVGEIEVYVNEKKLVSPILEKQTHAAGIVVKVPESTVNPYFINGQENIVTLKTKTKDNTLFSRGVPIADVSSKEKKIIIPNLYIVSIGVSEYKNSSINLGYAGKDAVDMTNALAFSSRALLNADGKEHVFCYTLSSESNIPGKPYKEKIFSVLKEINEKATANDIVAIFMAGHGKVSNGQFYFLTAEASNKEIAGVENLVAISQTELDEWLRKIKAQKQVLILDACQSGQLLESQKRDMSDDQLRAFERLKDRTGLFILTASSSSQSAYENSKYDQGLLTYSLLHGIKSGQGLKNNYLDVSTWFNHAADYVKVLTNELGLQGRQNPETIGKASFDIGLVNEQIKESIRISSNKKMFNRSKFYIDPILLNDDENLSSLADATLNSASLKPNTTFVFSESASSKESLSMRGIYELHGNEITINFSLIKGDKIKINGSTLKGKLEEKASLINQMVEQVNIWIK